MPPKAKVSSKAKEAASKTKEPEAPPPKTANERTAQRYYQTNPCEKRREEVGLHGLTPTERQTWANAFFLPLIVSKEVLLSHKSDREFWKQVGKESLPVRRLSRARKQHHAWGRDRHGRDVGELSPEDFDRRSLQQARLAALEALHSRFVQRRELAGLRLTRPGSSDSAAHEDVTPEEVEEDRQRRKEMAALKSELYGEKMGTYAQDPEWDDVTPIPADEPEGALAAIAYPDDYAEAISYLRAVMAAEEYSPRTLRLTEHVISLNAAHYTVWLYRFKIVQALDLSIPDEIEWLNQVSLENLKNYQIWHHRQLLLDHYHAQISANADADALKKLARSESEFLRLILDEDTKNYHVWSYRQSLVRKLGLWTPQELAATQSFIEDDVRNNSAWHHRFFLVFCDPAASTPGCHATEHDPAVPAETVDREVRYAQEKAALAPQNQAAWNYLRGVLAKGARPLASAEEFAARFVEGVGEGEGREKVRSSHALVFLADVWVEKGEKEKAALYLSRLAEKWDPIRAGYWNYRKQQIAA
ncbi:prenyltransferase [Sodiomyces alkalinus F11]|uniref:Protein farnesyltransferase/geranylgeranyltransferase type-1 subunit alpha n=1 Tax=Sodiomyces alkalinus (strain CBS 110278 / VKM F-3762 / F11) TaxID=1314773 RepID=A0A3N2QAE4_SODAK|nr:prenyltransferase [Sodiomyces alkalinus F11]ROT43719.1 prenyltransferase [Sodiomyces alkalinus F11]